jgi:hypothetical protein
MNLRVLQIIKNKLQNQKMIAEGNIEHFLMDVNLSPDEKADKIIQEIDNLKNSSQNLDFWDEFVKNNIIIPNQEEITNQKNS